MNLKEFVSNVLIDVVEGITSAQESLEGAAIINPLGYPNIIKLNEGKEPSFSSIYFEVALEIKESDKSKGEGELTVAFMNGGLRSENECSSSKLNKIKFEVPISYPPGKIVL